MIWHSARRQVTRRTFRAPGIRAIGLTKDEAGAYWYSPPPPADHYRIARDKKDWELASVDSAEPHQIIRMGLYGSLKAAALVLSAYLDREGFR